MTPKKSAPSKAVAKTRLKVPSTRVDKAPGKEMELRAAEPMTVSNPSVVLVAPDSSTVTVTSLSDFYAKVYTLGYTPQSGSVHGDYLILKGAAPAADPNAVLRMSDIANSQSAARAALGAALVTVGTSQTISGAKDFTQAPTVGGSPFGTGGVALVSVPDATTDMAATIAASIETLRQSDGKLHGTLRISGKAPAKLASALVIDGGYTDVTPADANWQTSTPRRFAIEGDILPAAGLGAAITMHGMYGAEVDLRVHGGGVFSDSTDGSITSGQKTLTSAAAVAAGVKAGGFVMVDGAGPLYNGTNYPLIASVRSVAGNVLTLSLAASATVSAVRVRAGDVALRCQDHVNLNLRNLDVKNYAGTGLMLDSADDATKRVRQSAFGTLQFNQVDYGLLVQTIDAFGSLGRIWFNARQLGIYLGNADDVGWEHIEGGVGALPDASANYIWFNKVSSCNGGRIATGDRATDAQVLITGGDVGFIERIRATGYAGFSSPSAIRLVDVSSLTLGHAYTRECQKGVHIVGGGGGSAAPRSAIVIYDHQSLTDDTNAVYIEPSATMTTPFVQIGANYRRTKGDSVVVAAGLTGGKLNIHGLIDQPNSDGAAGVYAINCQSSACSLNVAGLHQTERAVLSGAIFHADPSKVLGVDRAWLEGSSSATDAIAHGGAVTVLTTPVGGADQRNTSPQPAWVCARVQMNPTGAADATATLYLGYWGVGGATQSVVQFAKEVRKAGSVAGDEVSFIFPVRAYGRWQIAVTNATILEARQFNYS